MFGGADYARPSKLRKHGALSVNSAAADAAIASALQIEAYSDERGPDGAQAALSRISAEIHVKQASAYVMSRPLPGCGSAAEAGLPQDTPPLLTALQTLGPAPSVLPGAPLQRSLSAPVGSSLQPAPPLRRIASDALGAPASATRPAAAPVEEECFTFAECTYPIVPEPGSLPLRQPTMWPAVQLRVHLQLPLLFWEERRSWMWHKKWTLPKVHVRVSTLDGAVAAEERAYQAYDRQRDREDLHDRYDQKHNV